jgi:hypothetical protein
VATLDGVLLAPFRLGLHDRLVGPLAEAFRTVASMPVHHDLSVGRKLPLSEVLERARVIVLDVREAHPSVGFGDHQNQLLVRPARYPDERLVELHERAERFTVGSHHRRAQLVQPASGRLVRSRTP